MAMPISICIAVFVNLVACTLTDRYAFAFLPHLVKWIGNSEQQTGTNVGTITSAMFTGRFLSCFLWGYLVNRFGARKCAILSGITIAIMNVGFGFCHNLLLAIIVRALTGLLAGHYVIFKTLVGEVCKKDDLSFGMSLIQAAGLIRATLGPSIGGLLSFPSEKYSKLFKLNGVFGEYPSLLPSLVTASVCAIGVIFSFFCLPVEVQDDEDEVEVLCSNGNADEYDVGLSDQSDHPPNHEMMKSSILQGIRASKFMRVIAVKEAMIIISFIGMFAFVTMGFVEIFPIFATTATEYHGLGKTESALGIMLLLEGIITSILLLLAVPKVHYYLGSKALVTVSTIPLVVLLPVTPSTALLKSSLSAWICAIIVFSFARLAMLSGSVALHVLASGSVEKEILGATMGIISASLAAGRAISTIVCGFFYSWSLTNIAGIIENKNALGFPFDNFFVFFVLSGTSLGLLLFTRALPKKEEFK